jgi:hypothetical protein
VITAASWYQLDRDLENYYQGDILSEIPFPTLPTFLPAARQDVWAVVRPRPNKSRPDTRPVIEIMRNLPNELIGRAAKDLVDLWADPLGEHIIAHCRKMTVMLVSRSCDIDKMSRKHFLVAPVIAIKSLPDAQRTDDKLRDLRANEIFHWFYLPENGDLPESYADLSVMVPFHRTFFEVELLRTNLLGRLSAEGTLRLQTSLSNFYGIKFGFSPPDSCPQSGTYACSTCFHSGVAAPLRKEMKRGDYFGVCLACKEEAIWVQLPGELEEPGG